jgi:predicted deacetylase
LTAVAANRLLLSIHDVSPRHAGPVAQLADLFERLAPGRPYAMLVVPDFWRQAPLRADPAFCRQLRAWSDRGIEMFLHGECHRDESVHDGAVARLKAGVMTASEGEFLGLSRAEALRRLTDGRALLEDIIGRSVAGFVAPAWLYGPGAMAALAELDLPMAEDHFRVWRPRDGRVLARGPVITWATRTPAREASSLFFASLARTALHVLPNVRVAVHPGDVTSPAVIDSITRTISAFTRRRAVEAYASLMPA